MIYSNHFVMCVLVNGKPLKERADGIVTIPLGAEYTIRFKNKNNRRAMVTFTIDGENASGNGYIINAHQDVEIKRFSDRDQMFKFVHLDSAEAQLDGKNGPNWDGSKGVIEARFYLEKQYTPPPAPVYTPIPIPYPAPYPVPVWPKPYRPYYQPMWTDNTWPNTNNPYSGTYGCATRGMSAGVTKGASCGGMQMSCGGGMQSSLGSVGMESCAPPVAVNFTAPQAAPAMMEGVTVGGQVSGQHFYTVSFDAETDYVTLRLVLRGTNEPVQQVCTEEVEYCSGCGTKRSRKSDKFCGKCGIKL